MVVNFNFAEFEKSVGDLKQFDDNHLPEIVFSGKSNVGKSSLINKILNRKALARTSSQPGKTVNINLYKLKNVRFVDLPGYGYAKVSFSEKQRWSKLVEGYFNSSKNIALVVQIIDMRHAPSAQDLQMLEYLYNLDIPFVIAFSKSDKLNKTERTRRESEISQELKEYENIPKIFFSAVNAEGTEQLKSFIEKSVIKFKKEGII